MLVMRSRGARLLVVLAAGVVLAACSSGGLKLPADAAGTELFEEANALAAAGKWRQAGEAYDALLRNYPTSPHLPEARLGLGRAYYEQGRVETLILAIDAFRNFMTYHPSHPSVDYAQLMVGMSYVQMMRSPDRDQANSRAALEAFEVFMEDYPGSSYMEEARQNLQIAVDALARHEMQVAEFQIGRGMYEAAQARCHYALRTYPQTSWRCGILYTLGEAYRKGGDAGQARATFERLLQDDPDCEYAEKARGRLKRGEQGGPTDAP